MAKDLFRALRCFMVEFQDLSTYHASNNVTAMHFLEALPGKGEPRCAHMLDNTRLCQVRVGGSSSKKQQQKQQQQQGQQQEQKQQLLVRGHCQRLSQRRWQLTVAAVAVPVFCPGYGVRIEQAYHGCG
jgi:transcription initiation factor TFIID subunit TAF12